MQGAKDWSEGHPSRTPSMVGGPSQATNHLGKYAMYDLDGDGHVSMEEIVTATFKNLFPDSFQCVLEVRNHKVRLVQLRPSHDAVHWSLLPVSSVYWRPAQAASGYRVSCHDAERRRLSFSFLKAEGPQSMKPSCPCTWCFADLSQLSCRSTLRCALCLIPECTGGQDSQEVESSRLLVALCSLKACFCRIWGFACSQSGY